MFQKFLNDENEHGSRFSTIQKNNNYKCKYELNQVQLPYQEKFIYVIINMLIPLVTIITRISDNTTNN